MKLNHRYLVNGYQVELSEDGDKYKVSIHSLCVSGNWGCRYQLRKESVKREGIINATRNLADAHEGSANHSDLLDCLTILKDLKERLENE